MKTKLIIALTVLITIISYSCKKDNQVDIPPAISNVGIIPEIPGALDYITVTATIQDAYGLKAIRLYYKVSNDNVYTSVSMSAGADNTYSAPIPSFPAGTVVNYYIEAINNSDLSAYFPANAPTSILHYTVGQSSVLINELFPWGTTENPDWIEIYNKSSSPVNISSFKIYDSGGLNGTKPKMEFPAGTIIPANGYLVIVVDDANSANPSNSDFGLTTAGEEIWLESAAGYIIDDVILPAILVDNVSYGRNPDGSGNWQIQSTITRNAPNTAQPPGITGLTVYPENPGSTESVLVSATITDSEGLSSVTLYYNVEGGEFSSLTMTPSGNIYSASIPAQPGGSHVNYYILARDIYALESLAPVSAPDIPGSYTVVAASAIFNFTRTPVNPTALETVNVSATITDATGINTVILYYKTGTNSYASVTMSPSGNNYSAEIPAFAGGTLVSYYIEVTNTSNQKTYAPANGLTVPESYTVLGPILINEIYSRGIVTEPDWVEIYNLSNNPVDISGYKIYDIGGQSGSKPKMEIPTSTTLQTNEYYVIVVDDATTANPAGSDFGLSGSGEDLWLENAGGTVIDHIYFGTTTNTQSYGRSPNGRSFWYTLNPITKGSSNPNVAPPK